MYYTISTRYHCPPQLSTEMVYALPNGMKCNSAFVWELRKLGILDFDDCEVL